MTENQTCPKCKFESMINGICMRTACQNPKSIRSNLKTNFRDEDKKWQRPANDLEISKEGIRELTPEEFENYIIESGAAGSFMVYRNHTKKDEELGLDTI